MNLKQRIRDGEFVITAEIVPPLSVSPDRLLEEAALLGNRVTAINVWAANS